MRSFYETKNVFITWSLEEKCCFRLCLSTHFPLSERCPYLSVSAFNCVCPLDGSIWTQNSWNFLQPLPSHFTSESLQPIPADRLWENGKNREREHASSPSPVCNQCPWHGELQQNHICISRERQQCFPKENHCSLELNKVQFSHPSNLCMAFGSPNTDTVHF